MLYIHTYILYDKIRYGTVKLLRAIEKGEGLECQSKIRFTLHSPEKSTNLSESKLESSFQRLRTKRLVS